MDLVTLQGPATEPAVPGTFVVLRDLGDDVEGVFYPDEQPAGALRGGELAGFKLKLPKLKLPKIKMPSFNIKGGGLNLKLPKLKMNLKIPKSISQAGQRLMDANAQLTALPLDIASGVVEAGTGLLSTVASLPMGLLSSFSPGAQQAQQQQHSVTQQQQQPYQDPQTGMVWDGQRWTDPATGLVYDEASGQWLDPATGQPAGQSQQQPAQQGQLQYDAQSGAYYDPTTGIYYDPNSGQPLNGGDEVGFLPQLLAAAAPALLPVAGNIADRFLPGAGGILNTLLPGLLPGMSTQRPAPPPRPRAPAFRPAPVVAPRSAFVPPPRLGQEKGGGMGMAPLLIAAGLAALLVLKK